MDAAPHDPNSVSPQTGAVGTSDYGLEGDASVVAAEGRPSLEFAPPLDQGFTPAPNSTEGAGSPTDATQKVPGQQTFDSILDGVGRDVAIVLLNGNAEAGDSPLPVLAVGPADVAEQPELPIAREVCCPVLPGISNESPICWGQTGAAEGSAMAAC